MGPWRSGRTQIDSQAIKVKPSSRVRIPAASQNPAARTSPKYIVPHVVVWRISVDGFCHIYEGVSAKLVHHPDSHQALQAIDRGGPRVGLAPERVDGGER